MEKFRNKYRIDSTRLKNYDYSLNGAYFITIVTKNRKHFFGKIINKQIQLSKIGEIALNEWYKSIKIRPDMNIILDEFVVMPNHIHGIIIIGENSYNSESSVLDNDAKSISSIKPTITTNFANNIKLNKPNLEYNNKFGLQSKNIASIVRGYKAAVTIKSRKINSEFGWQERFHDRIIRNKEEFNRIKKYINENPLKWDDDNFSQPENPFIIDCNSCKTRCDGQSKGIYNFKNDVEFAEEQENLIIKKINTNPNYFARKTSEAGYPDIEIFNRDNVLINYLEIKAQRRTFMSVERILPKSGLKPSETLALNLSDLLRYFEIEKQTKIPTSILWVLMNRPCLVNNNEKRFFFQKTTNLKEIYLQNKTSRRFRRKSGKGDVVDGEHKGVVVNYHFSINELKEWKT